MSTYEERLTALEQTSVTRAEFNQYVRQQGQTLKDRTHETAIPLGMLTDDTRILKENVYSIRIRMNEGFGDLSQELYSVDEKAEKRFRSLETKVTAIEQDIKNINQQLSDILALLKSGRSDS